MFAMNYVSILKKKNQTNKQTNKKNKTKQNKKKHTHISKHPYIVWIYKMLVVTILFNRHGKTRANDFQD